MSVQRLHAVREIGCNDGLCVVYLTVTGQRVTVRETDIDRIDQEGQTDDHA
jgi:thiamine phosphate synthase YjbQ (UPF0047 family)